MNVQSKRDEVRSVTKPSRVNNFNINITTGGSGPTRVGGGAKTNGSNTSNNISGGARESNRTRASPGISLISNY